MALGAAQLFPSSASELYSFKARSGTDVFYAQYTPKGVLKWLKVAGGKGTDYCTAIAIHKEHLYTFGMADAPIKFGKKQTENKRKAFWLAKFKLNELAKIDHTPPLPPPPKPKTINTITCECTQTTHQPKFAPPIKELASFEDFSELSQGWKPARADNFYQKMYYRNFQFQTSRSGGFYSMTALCFRPMELIHPDETFTVNFSPCTSENRHTEIPLTVNYSVAARNYMSSFV